MKVSEIKGELDMRGISHSGLYEKRELVHRLEEARALGQADPSIVDKFNKKMLETRVDPEMKAAMDDMANDPDLLNKIKASGKAHTFRVVITLCHTGRLYSATVVLSVLLLYSSQCWC
jgi:hypothetical protein